MAAIVFWLSFGIAAYVYVGYPLVLLAWKRPGARTAR